VALPLAGLRVVDLADEKAELGGRILADLGADVVRVEPPGGGRSRSLHPMRAGRSLHYAIRNSNKRGVVIDLEDPAGRDRLLRLLARADLWIETTRPGQLAGLGLDPREVTERLGHLVTVSVTDFGQNGPYRDWVGTDDVVVAMAGELFRSGVPELPPLLVPGALAYDVGGIMAAFSGLAAHWQRISSTGVGQHIDVSILEATAQVTDWSLANYSAIRGAGGLYGEVRSGHGPVYPLYPCADGYVRLVILSPRQWHAMRAWLGEPEILQDEHWDSLLGRLSIQHDILDPMFKELFADKDMAELAAEAQRRGIVMTPCLHPRAVLETQHFADRGSFVTAEVAPGVTGRAASGFFEVDGERAGFRRRAPEIGEHDGEVDGSWDDLRPPPPAGPDRSAPALPFRGLRVLDFGHGGVGVETGRLFAEYGADVIKIESRAYPDFIRQVSGGEMSASFASSSRSKRSFGVNVKTPEGLELVKALVAQADVVIENNSTGTMDDLGLGYEDLKKINPGIVMVSSQLMGSRGSWAAWLGYGPSTRPVGGMTWLWNFPGGGMPPGAMVIFPDHVAGRICAIGALAALVARRATGSGAHVEVAQVETVLGMMAPYFLAEDLAPGSVQPLGNRREQGAPWGVYQCQGEQRWCVICCRDDTDWAGLRAALDDPEWARDAELGTAAGRHARHDDIDAHLSTWTAGRTDRQVMEVLQAHGVPAGMMAYASDQPSDPHLQQRGYLAEVHQPGVGDMILEGPAFQASGMPPPIITAAPWLGEHTRPIARDLLGLDDERTTALVSAGVLEVTEPAPG
jgi:crotonobetainyl-CoA:carnitine CoA-transferase CaiB-like acyl-CoA transferase